MSNTKICIYDLVSSYKGSGQEPIIDDYPSCVQAKIDGASITFVGVNVHAEDVHASLNGDYIFRGTQAIY